MGSAAESGFPVREIYLLSRFHQNNPKRFSNHMGTFYLRMAIHVKVDEHDRLSDYISRGIGEDKLEFVMPWMQDPDKTLTSAEEGIRRFNELVESGEIKINERRT